MADEMEAQLAAQKETIKGPSAVEPALERETGVPFWLRQYMQGQPKTDPFGEPVFNKEGAVRGNKYMTEAEKERYLRTGRF